MEDSRKHLLIGIVASIVVTPFVGGALTGYLNKSSILGGVKTGGYVGVLASVVVGVLWTVFYHFTTIQPISALPAGAASGSPPESYFWMELFRFLFLLFVTGILSGMVGGGIGGYVADYQSNREQKPMTA